MRLDGPVRGGGGVTSGMWSPAATRGEGALYWLQEYRLMIKVMYGELNKSRIGF